MRACESCPSATPIPRRSAKPSRRIARVRARKAVVRNRTTGGALVPNQGIQLVSYLLQQGEPAGGAAGGAKSSESRPETLRESRPGQVPGKPGAKLTPEEEEDLRRRLRQPGSDVEMEILPDLDAIILRGRDREVKELQRLINEIERLSAETEPAIDIYYLRHVGGEALAAIIKQVNEDFLGGRQGRVTIVPLVKPNALLLIGWGEAVKAAKELIARLDQPVAPAGEHRVFRLKNAVAATVATTVTQFFAGRNRTAGGLGPQVAVTADPLTNSIIVHASPRDLAEVELLLERLDVGDTDAVLQTRIFRLFNTLAGDVAATLQAAIGRGARRCRRKIGGLGAPHPRSEGAAAGQVRFAQRRPDHRRSAVERAHRRRACREHGPAGGARHATRRAGVAAQIKVFHIENGDARSMAQMLNGIVPAGGAPSALAHGPGESSLVPLRFSIEARTNSIIAVGSPTELHIIEALIVRLDELDVQRRQTAVYRLKNAPADDVARAVNDFLRSERQVQSAIPGVLSPFQQIEAEVVVVPEPVSNTLIISATPRFFKEIAGLVEKLDAQPAQVIIQVLIADIQLTNTQEFGIELGLQNSALFDRSLLAGNLQTITNTVQTSTPAGITTSTQQTTPAATLTPGYNFNSTATPLGSGTSAQSLASAATLGTQGLTDFALGRQNSQLGFGGLVLSASSDAVSVLLRAMQASQRMEVLSRPQITTLDNQPAYIQVGQRVPRITGSVASNLGLGQVFNTLDMVNVGLIMGVTPRISPDGMVVMEVDAENSSLAPVEEGIPVSVSAGQVIRSPSINTTNAQTTISAADGETIVLGGLITKGTTKIDRRVPLLADIPLLGVLFRYDSVAATKHELLIILTPHIVRTPEERERIKRMESARMSWCLGDLEEIHGDVTGMKQYGGRSEVIYPDVNPRGSVKSSLEPILPQAIPPQGNSLPPPAGTAPLPVPPGDGNRARPVQPESVPLPPAVEQSGASAGRSGTTQVSAILPDGGPMLYSKSTSSWPPSVSHGPQRQRCIAGSLRRPGAHGRLGANAFCQRPWLG